MTPQTFIQKWGPGGPAFALNEEQGAHKELDMAVAAAYGWADYSADMADEEILKRLLALNLARAGTA